MKHLALMFILVLSVACGKSSSGSKKPGKSFVDPITGETVIQVKVSVPIEVDGDTITTLKAIKKIVKTKNGFSCGYEGEVGSSSYVVNGETLSIENNDLSLVQGTPDNIFGTWEASVYQEPISIKITVEIKPTVMNYSIECRAYLE